MKSAFPAFCSNVVFRRSLAWAVLALSLNVLASDSAAQAAPTGGLINPRAIAFNPANGKVYAVDTSHSAVLIYSANSSRAKSVPVGREPVSLAVNTTTGKAYIANGGDGTVSVLDGRSDAVIATVAIGNRPYSIAVNSVTGKVYATHTYDDRLSILDGATNAATSLKTGSTDLITIDPDTDTIYLLGYEGGTVLAIDGAKQSIRKLETGMHAWGITVDGKTGTVYVARVGNAAVASLSKGSTTAVDFPAGAIPSSIAVDSKANKLYVADYGDNSVTVIDAGTGRKAATIEVGRHPKGIAFDPVRNLVYTANAGGDTVTVIDATNNTVLATLPAGKSPYALAVVPGSNKLYVADESEDNASIVVDLSGIRK
jgi:YVTN family beta-propeller protein